MTTSNNTYVDSTHQTRTSANQNMRVWTIRFSRSNVAQAQRTCRTYANSIVNINTFRNNNIIRGRIDSKSEVIRLNELDAISNRYSIEHQFLSENQTPLEWVAKKKIFKWIKLSQPSDRPNTHIERIAWAAAARLSAARLVSLGKKNIILDSKWKVASRHRRIHNGYESRTWWRCHRHTISTNHKWYEGEYAFRDRNGILNSCLASSRKAVN